MNNGEKLLVMRNVRSFIDGRIKQPENWVLYSRVFSAGANVSRKKCMDMNLDPDETRLVEPL